jgi:hypothetical protein
LHIHLAQYPTTDAKALFVEVSASDMLQVICLCICLAAGHGAVFALEQALLLSVDAIIC